MTSRLGVKRILYATDFLESSRLALDYAVAFANHFRADIVMLHVIELSQAAQEVELTTSGPSATRKSASHRLESLASGVSRLGLQVETHVKDGVVCDVVVESIERYCADLLVLGIHGIHRGLDHLLIGSNAEKILLSASCPTLTVGAHVLSGVDQQLHFKEVVYFSDFTPEATAAAPYAIYYGKEFGARVDVCQLLPTARDENQRNKLAEEYCGKMKDVLASSDSTWCEPAFQLDRGMEIEQIIKRAQGENAGLIVLGVRMQSQFGRHLHTSFAYRLLAEATCPVLTIRHDSKTSLQVVANYQT